MCLNEMAPVCRPVCFADNHVRMHLGLALAEGYIAHQRQDFNLLGERMCL